MKLIDPATGEPPVLRSSDSITIEATLVEGSEVPDGVDDDGDEVRYASVATGASSGGGGS